MFCLDNNNKICNSMADALGIVSIAFVVAISFTARDLLLTKETTKAVSEDQSKSEGTKVAPGPVGPNIKFLICHG